MTTGLQVTSRNLQHAKRGQPENRKPITGVTQKEEAQEIRLTKPPKTPSGWQESHQG